jgi:cation transport regulator
MPYSANSDLPAAVKDHLPEHAQSIFRKVFNSAHDEYHDEVTAFKVAWDAVKKSYEKSSDGMWIKRVD